MSSITVVILPSPAPFIPPPPPPPPPPPFQPPPSVLYSFQLPSPLPFQPPPQVFNSFQTPPPTCDNSFGNFHIPAQLSSSNFGNREQGLSGNIFGSQTQALTREKETEKVVQDSVEKKLEDIIYKLSNLPRLELGDGLLN